MAASSGLSDGPPVEKSTIAGLAAGWHHFRMSLPANIDQLSADELRRLLVEQDRELNLRKVWKRGTPAPFQSVASCNYSDLASRGKSTYHSE